MSNNSIVIPISLPKVLAKELDGEAKKELMTRSEYIRSLLRKQLAFTKMQDFRGQFARHSKNTGLKTLGGAVKQVRVLRQAK